MLNLELVFHFDFIFIQIMDFNCNVKCFRPVFWCDVNKKGHSIKITRFGRYFIVQVCVETEKMCQNDPLSLMNQELAVFTVWNVRVRMRNCDHVRHLLINRVVLEWYAKFNIIIYLMDSINKCLSLVPAHKNLV